MAEAGHLQYINTPPHPPLGPTQHVNPPHNIFPLVRIWFHLDLLKLPVGFFALVVRFVPIRAGFDPRQVLHTGLLVNFVQASIGPPNINQRLQSRGEKRERRRGESHASRNISRFPETLL